MTQKKKSSEFDIIAKFFAPLAKGEPGAFGLTDDAASIAIKQDRLIVTTDTLIAGIHFPNEVTADLIAIKLLAVNLSDMAAMGARPYAYTMSMALPKDIDDHWLQRFSRSLAAMQKTCGVTLIGGDTVSTPGPLTLSVNMMGTAQAGSEMLRSAASVDDLIYVSGTIGDASLGLMAMGGELAKVDDRLRQQLIKRYHQPQPRVQLGMRLAAGGLAHAAIDVSDGLIADLGHICQTSKVAATVNMNSIPLSSAARASLDAYPKLTSAVLGGGDDYELLFTAAANGADQLSHLSNELGLPLSVIGRINEANSRNGDKRNAVRVVDKDGNKITIAHNGYQHF